VKVHLGHSKNRSVVNPDGNTRNAFAEKKKEPGY